MMSNEKKDTVILIGLESSNDEDWGLYALSKSGEKYAISESEYGRLQKERRETGNIPSLDFSQVLFVKTDASEVVRINHERVDGLLAYLDGLTKLTQVDGGYICTKEIRECIDEVRAELGIKE